MEKDPARADKAAAFEEARRKFAAYSRVSNSNARDSREAASSAAAASRLRTTASLQADGELAAQLADADYLLAGILDASPRGNGASDALVANVIELTVLLQSHEVRAALLYSGDNSSGDYCARLRQVLRLLLPHRHQDQSVARYRSAEIAGDEGAGTSPGLLRMSVSVLAYFLTLDPDAAVVLVDEHVFAAFAGALKAETDAIAMNQSDADVRAATPRAETTTIRSDRPLTAAAGCGLQGDAATLQGQSGDAKAPQRKSCLKRKRTGAESTISHENSMATTDNGSSAKRPESSDAAIRDRLHAFVDGEPVFVVASNRLSPSAADVLCGILHNLLEIESPTAASVRELRDAHIASRQDDYSAELSSTESPRRFHPEQRQPGAAVALGKQQSGVHAAFRATRDRKTWLVQSGALDTLVHMLQLRLAPLVDLMHPESSKIRVLTEECDQADVLAQQSALRRLWAVLQVLDQASFFASNVQRRLSRNRKLFVMLLAIVHVLGDVCWGANVLRVSASNRECVTEAVNVFLAAMHLIINLTHQNAAADAHMSSLDGMRVLFDMFCHMLHLKERTSALDVICPTQAVDGASSYTGQSVVIEDKLVYDVYLLLLSAMANCVENSEENRQALSQLVPANTMAIGGGSPVSVCTLLTQFFLAKVQSYIRFIDDSRGDAVDLNDDDDDADWNPDDVILGGCSALLLGCLMNDSRDNVNAILTRLPGQSPRLLLRALEVFVALHAHIGALTPVLAASVLRVETTLKGILFQVMDQVRPQSGDATAFGAAHEIPRQTDQEEDDAKATTPSWSVIMSPDRATTVRDRTSSGASPSPARAAQRRRNLYASLSDSDGESGAQGNNGSVMLATLGGSDDSHHQDAETNTSTATAGRSTGWASPAPKSPSRKRLSSRSPPSSFRTPSPSRRKRSAKNLERQQSCTSSVASVSSKSRRLLKEARSLIDDLDDEFARAACTPASSSSGRTVQCSLNSSATSLGSISSEYCSRDRDEDGDGKRTIATTSTAIVATSCSVLELIGSEDSPVPAKKTERKRKRKDYRLPTSPFRRVGRPPSSGDLRSGVRPIFQQSASVDSDVPPSTPVHNTEATHMTPLRHSQLLNGLRIEESPVGESPARRKPKGVRAAPSPLAAAIFDFDE